MAKVPAISVELSPLEFPVVNCAGTFHVDDEVTITKSGGETLEGRITKLLSKMYGNPAVPGLSMCIAITSGRLQTFRNGGFAGYTITKTSDPATNGTIRTPCLTKCPARLLGADTLRVMVEVGQELIRRAALLKKSDYVLQWFGQAGFEPKARDAIYRRSAELHEGVAGLTHVIFVCGHAEDMGAVALDDPLRNGTACRIRLGRGFSYDRYGWGELVCTIIHEMTHWFLTTVDAQLGDGRPCYGGLCLKLANSKIKSDREKALNNADNWAYYICQYRDKDDTRDWRFFTLPEIEARGPFVSGSYNVVESRMAFN
jgi:hypothetical protein